MSDRNRGDTPLEIAVERYERAPFENNEDVSASRYRSALRTIQSLTEERDLLKRREQATRDLLEMGTDETLARLVTTTEERDALRAVERAARVFASQPGVRLSEPFESAWLDLRDALAALSTTKDRGEP